MTIYTRLPQLATRSFQNTRLSVSSTRALSLWVFRQLAPSRKRGHHQNVNSRFFWYASSAATGFALTTLPLLSLSPMTLSMAEYSVAATQPATRSPVGKPDIVLYQFEVCPFCNKVRAYLDYHGISYRVVEVDPLRKTELKKFAPEYRKVPIALIDNKQVNGSSDVIEAVRTATGQNVNESISSTERQWLAWLDDHLIHLIAPNIYRSPGESLQTFNYIAEKSKFSWWERATIKYTGAAAMYMIGKRLKKKYDLNDVRLAMHDAVSQWMAALREGGSDYLDGRKEPGVADLSVYGVLKALQTFDTFSDLRKQNEEFARWFDRMQAIIGDSAEIKGE